MRKVRTILIVILILALAATGISFAARRTASASSGRIVEVTAVENVNDYSGYASFDTMEGVIVSKDTQTVQRNTSYSIKKIYVHEGDKVSKGDKLLEYDMEKVELEAEKAGLDKWGLELELESMEKELALLKRGIMPVDDDSTYRYSSGTGSSSWSDDSDDSDEADDSDYYEDYDDEGDADYEDEEYVDATASEDIIAETELVFAQEDIAEDVIDVSEDSDYGIVEDDLEDAIIVEDTGEELISDTSGEVITDGGDDEELALLSSVNEFLRTVNAVTETANASLASLGTDEQSALIEGALETFRTKFGEAMSTQQTTILGEVITVTDYTVTGGVASIVGETTAHVLQTAYDRLCAYQFVSVMERLNPDKISSSSETEASAQEKEESIRAAANLLASLPSTVYNPGDKLFTTAYDGLNAKWTSDGLESRVEYLEDVAALFNGSTVIEQNEEIIDTVSTEGISSVDTDIDYDYDGGDDYDSVDFATMIKEMESSIFEEKLLIREAELEVKEYDEKLSGKIIYAILDGVVLSSSSSGQSSDNGPIMVITGKKGFYVKGVIKENSLDTVKVGDIVYGSSYSGYPFTAEIVEVSVYPDTGNNYYYYGFGDENSNESSYPFLAFIEDTEGLEVDDGVELSLDGEVSGYGYSMGDGLALNSCFIRTEEGGRSYCLVEGSDGLLEKRYLELGSNDWGTITVKSGLSREDYIAFPYGKGVEEGAKTTRVDSLKALSYDSEYY